LKKKKIQDMSPFRQTKISIYESPVKNKVTNFNDIAEELSLV
jgi:hypothetical protein